MYELVNSPKVTTQTSVRNENILSTKLRNAYGAITGYWDKPGDTEKISLMMFDKLYTLVMDRINKFFYKDWLNYRKAVEDAKISLFDN